MRSKRRKTLLSVCSVLALLTVAGATGLTLHRAQADADTTTTATPTFEMHYGASIRISDPTGIRFGAKLGTEYYEELSADNSDAQLHVVVIPYAMYTAYQADTTKGTTAVYPWLVSQYGTAGFVDLAIPTENFYSVTENGKTYYYANAVLSNVYFNNYHLEFVGVAYLQRGTAGSYTYQDVANVNEENNARSIFEVACKASSDEEEYAKYKDFLDETTEKAMYRAYGVSCAETIDSEGIKTAESYTYNGTTYATYDEMKTGVGITVSESTVTIEGETIEVVGGTETQLNATVNFSDGTEFTKNAYYTWSSSDETVATVDKNGVVTTKGAGSATITVSAIGGRFTDTCTVNVTKGGTVNLDYEFLARGDADVYTTDTGNATIDLTEMGIVGTNVTEVLCNGEAVTIASATATSITLTNAPAGDQEYTFKTTAADYVVNGCVYGYGISTKEELINWRTTYASAVNYKAYTVLLDDIDLEGTVLDDVTSYFYATFDGRGHTISDFTYQKGFIWLMYPSVIKNVQFTEAVQDCTFKGTSVIDHGFFGPTVRGTIENIKVSVTTKNMQAEHRGMLFLGLNHGNTATAPSLIQNVVMEVTPQTDMAHYAYQAQATTEGLATIDNVYMYFTTSGTGGFDRFSNGVYTNSGFYASQAAMLAEVDFSTWAEPWQVDFYGAPYIGEPIERETIEIAGEFLAQGDAGTTVTNTGNATFDLSSTGYDFSGTARVLCDGEAVTVAGSTATTVTVTDAPAGEHVYTIVTPTADYIINGFVYGQGISTKDEFLAWQTAAAAGTGKCYTVLLDDIDLEGATLAAPTTYYYGMFDGMGHTVSDFTYTNGVIWLMYPSVFKNAQFTEAIQDCSFTADPQHGFFGQTVRGTIENLKICLTTKNITAAAHRGVLMFGLNHGNDINAPTLLQNVVVEVTPQADVAHYVLQAQSKTEGLATINNVHMYFTTSGTGGFGRWNDTVHTNSGFYANQAAMLSAVDFSTWAEPWYVDANGVPYIGKAQVSAPDTGKVRVTLDGVIDAPTTTENVMIDFTDKIADITTVSSVLCGTLNVEYTVNGNVLTLKSVPAGKKVYTIETSSKIYLVTLNVYEVEKTVVTLEDVFFGNDSDTTTLAIENATIDFTGTEVVFDNVQSVTYGDGVAATYSVNGNTLTLSNVSAGEATYTIETLWNTYIVKICLGYGISTKDEFVAWQNTVATVDTHKAYTVLLDDIDLEGTTLTGATAYYYGTFDGRAHTVSNFTYSSGLARPRGTGTVKNVQFIDAVQDCMFQGAVVVQAGLFGSGLYGTVENVKLSVTTQNISGTLDHRGVLAFTIGNGGTLTGHVKNVIIELSPQAGNYHYFSQTVHTGSTLENVHMYVKTSGAGALYGTNNGTATNAAFHDSTATMLKNVDFSTWEEPWQIGADGVPYIGEAIVRQTIEVEGEFLAQGDAGTAKANTGNATIDFTDTVINLSNVQSVTYGEENTAVNYSVSGNALTLTDAPAGDEIYTIVTSGDTYIINACIYGHGISTKEEFIAWRTANSNGSNNFWAYTVLLNDIDLEGAELDAAVASVMRGWLDGRGHTVANFTLKATSLVQTVYVDGGFKNIQFVNVTQDASTVAATFNWGILAQVSNGTIENVLIHGDIVGIGANQYIGVLHAGGSATTVTKNVIMDITTDGTATHWIIGWSWATGVTPTMIDNVYAVCNSSKSSMGTTVTPTNSGVYATESKLTAAVDFSSWSDPWIVDGNSLPYMSNYFEYLGFIHDAYVGTTSYKLVENGASDYKVLMDGDTHKEIWTTFTDFQTYFAEATGVTLSWANDAYASNYSDTAKFISLGKTAALEQSGIAVDYDLLGKQGYQIVTLGDDIYVCGENEGLSNAIYDLLNRLVGLEVYTTTRYAINTVTDLALPDLSIIEVPDIEYRVSMNGELSQYVTAVNATRRALRIHNMGDIIVSGGNAHNMLTDIVPYAENSAQTNWFNSNGTQLCYTAHGNSTDYNAMVAEAVENIKALLLADTTKSLLSLTQMDTKTWCDCSACSALNTTYGTDAAAQIIFVNDVTDIINTWLAEEQGGREVQFAIFAYYTTKTAPATQNADGTWTAIDETVILNDNVSVWIAPIEDDFRININETDNENNMRTMIESWSACASSYFIWSYDTYFNNYMIPYDTYDAIQDMVRFCAEYDTKFFYAQGAHDLTQNTAFGDVKAYLYSKLMWNSNLDVNTLIDNFFNDVYKDAAESMKSVFEAWRTKSATFDGNIYSSADSWLDMIRTFDNTWLKTQLGLLETAISDIAAYETSDPDLYTAIYDSIVAESISLRYLYKQRNGSEYSSSAWGTLAADAARLGVNMVSEGTAF